MCPAHACREWPSPASLGPKQSIVRSLRPPTHSTQVFRGHSLVPRSPFSYIHLCAVRHVQVSDRLADSQDLQPLQASLWTPPDRST